MPLSDGLAATGEIVSRLVARGLSNGEIAARLFVSLATVKTPSTGSAASSATPAGSQDVVWACENGLVVPGSASDTSTVRSGG